MTSTKGDNNPNEQQVPNSADHAPAPVTEAAEALHGSKARGEVFDQPDAVTLPGDTRIATNDEPGTGESSKGSKGSKRA